MEEPKEELLMQELKGCNGHGTPRRKLVVEGERKDLITSGLHYEDPNVGQSRKARALLRSSE